MDSRIRQWLRFDFTPTLAIVTLVFVAIVLDQFSHSWGDATRGLVTFEAAQKDLYVDADLVRDARGVHANLPLVQRLRSQTVLVMTRTETHHVIEGTGVIVGARGTQLGILTASHVVSHAGTRSVLFASHHASSVHSIVFDPGDDLALLWVPALPGEYTRATLARNDFATGDPFVVMGHPLDRSWAATPGIAEHHEHLTLLYCPQCDRGDSGAGAYDMHGALRGIITRKLIITAPSKRGDRYVSVTAFSTVRTDRIRPFLDRALR